MEEAEKRMERLRVMRMQSDQATSSQGTESSSGVPPSLVNPLNDPSASPASSPAAARFDFYTDPMAAFSKRAQVSHQVAQGYHPPPRPRIDATPTYRANTYPQGPGNDHNMQTTCPFGVPRVNSPGMFQGPEMYGGPTMGRPMQTSPFGPRPMNPPGVFSGFGGPRPMNPPAPGVFSGSSGPPNQNFPCNLPGGPNFYSPQRGGSPSFNYGRGRGQRFNDSHSPRPYRVGGSFQAGRGRNNSFSHGGRSGSHDDSFSAEESPDLFFNKSMLEDPWQMLKPVLWKTRNTGIHKYLKSYVPNFNNNKKAKLSDDSNKSTSEPSLAEYLAASFDDNESS